MAQHDYCAEIERVRALSTPVAREDYLRWAYTGNLASQARVYELSAAAWDRIQPTPSMDEQCSFMKRYFLACLEHPASSDEYVLDGFEAGHALSGWLKHLRGVPDAEAIITDVARALSELYKRLNGTGRNRLETGVLEHILEAPALRPYFEFWGDDPTLRAAYQEALAWGLAHTESDG